MDKSYIHNAEQKKVGTGYSLHGSKMREYCRSEKSGSTGGWETAVHRWRLWVFNLSCLHICVHLIRNQTFVYMYTNVYVSFYILNLK